MANRTEPHPRRPAGAIRSDRSAAIEASSPPRSKRLKALHDCVLFVQAMKHGFTVPTRTVRECDALLRIRADGRVLFYRT